MSKTLWIFLSLFVCTQVFGADTEARLRVYIMNKTGSEFPRALRPPNWYSVSPDGSFEWRHPSLPRPTDADLSAVNPDLAWVPIQLCVYENGTWRMRTEAEKAKALKAAAEASLPAEDKGPTTEQLLKLINDLRAEQGKAAVTEHDLEPTP